MASFCRRSFLSFTVPFCLLACSSVFAQSKVTADSEIEITSRNQKLLDALAETSLNLPSEPSRPQDVVVVFAGGGGHCTVLTVGLPETKAEDLAKALEKGLAASQLAPMKLTYGASKGKALVKGSYEFGSFGKTHGKLEIPVGKVSAALQAEGWKPTVYVRTYPVAKVLAEGMKVHEGARVTTRGVQAPSPDFKATIEVSVSPIQTGAFYFFLFGPWMLTIGGLLAAYIVAKRERIPVKRRRAIYPKLATWPAFGSIAVHAPFALWFIVGRGYQVFADLWFSSTSATTIMPFVILPLLPIMLMLPLVNKIERKLFGTDGDVPPVPELPAEVKAYNAKVSKLSLVFFGIGMGLVIFRIVVFDKSLVGLPIMMLGFALVALGRPIAERILKKEKPDLAVKPEEDDLVPELADLSQRMGLTEKTSLRIDATPLGMTNPYASVNIANVVTISWRLTELLNPTERRAIFAHELAHVKLGHVKQRKYILLGVMVVCFLPAIILPIALQSTSLARVLPFVMALPIAILPITLLFGSRWKRNQEYASDRLMLETTLDLESAVSALGKLAKNSPMPYIHENEVSSSHPAMSKRFEKLRGIASELGLKQNPPQADR